MTSATWAPSPPRPSLPRTGAGCEPQYARRRRRRSCWQKPIWSSMVNRSTDDDLAYRVTRALFEYKAQPAGIEKEPGTWTRSPPGSRPAGAAPRRGATTTRLWADARAVPDVARLERLGWRGGSLAGAISSRLGRARMPLRRPAVYPLLGWLGKATLGRLIVGVAMVGSARLSPPPGRFRLRCWSPDGAGAHRSRVGRQAGRVACRSHRLRPAHSTHLNRPVGPARTFSPSASRPGVPRVCWPRS